MPLQKSDEQSTSDSADRLSGPWIKGHFRRKPNGNFSIPVYRLHALQEMVPDLTAGPGLLAYALATRVLHHCFGHEWLMRHVIGDRPHPFFSKPLAVEGGHSTVVYRVRMLGEMVANLSRVPGVEAPFEQIANGKIESGYAELEVGKLLVSCGAEFGFVPPSETTGETFDIELVFPNGATVCAETKCRMERSTYSPNTIRNALKKSQQQLPKGRACAIFIKIPSEWQSNDTVLDDIRSVCDPFFKGTSRIAFVSTFADHVSRANGVVTARTTGTEIRNSYHDYNPDEWRLFTQPRQLVTLPPGWLQFPLVTGEAL